MMAQDKAVTSGITLYACRRKHMRPQGASYPSDKELWPLFDACGPEREISLGNPCHPGDYGKMKERLVPYDGSKI
jgi:hypothetical protein